MKIYLKQNFKGPNFASILFAVLHMRVKNKLDNIDIIPAQFYFRLGIPYKAKQ
jgi:hypothetical protein